MFKVKATAQRNYSVVAAPGFGVTPTATTTFVVKHKAKTTVVPSATQLPKGGKVKLSGYVGGTVKHSGLTVKVQFKASGKKSFVTKQSVTTNKYGAWKSKKLVVTKTGKWRAVIKNKGYVVGSTSTSVKLKIS